MYSKSKRVRVYKVQYGDTVQKISRKYQITKQELTELNPDINVNNLYEGQNILISQQDSDTEMITQGEMILNNHLRLLWEQHVYWTRMFIISTLFDLPDLEDVTNRLLQNPKDMAAAWMPFYGMEISAELEELFMQHFIIGAEVVNAAKAGDNTALVDAEKRWYENADQISEFFASINPNWTIQEWQEMLYSHLALTIDETVYILNQEYENSISVFDQIEKEALQMADMMKRGIIEQFPESFM